MGGFPVRRFLDNWEVGSLGGGQNGWEMKTSVSRLGCPLEMTLKSDRQSQIRPNCYHALRLLGDLDQISSFASNYEPITLPIHPQLVMGILWGEITLGGWGWWILKFWTLLALCPDKATSLFGLLFSHTCLATVACLSLQYPPLPAGSLTILDYQLPCD